MVIEGPEFYSFDTCSESSSYNYVKIGKNIHPDTVFWLSVIINRFITDILQSENIAIKNIWSKTMNKRERFVSVFSIIIF